LQVSTSDPLIISQTARANIIKPSVTACWIDSIISRPLLGDNTKHYRIMRWEGITQRERWDRFYARVKITDYKLHSSVMTIITAGMGIPPQYDH
jgi:hypothetical protein